MGITYVTIDREYIPLLLSQGIELKLLTGPRFSSS